MSHIYDGAADSAGEGAGPAQQGPAGGRSDGVSRRNKWLIGLVVVTILALALMSIIKVPVVILRAGAATDTLGQDDGKPVIQISGAQTYPTSGALNFTTVAVAGGPAYPVSVLDYLQAKFFDGDAQIDDEEKWFPKNITGQEVKKQNAADMTNSQRTAEVVAIRKSGRTVPERVLVGVVAEQAPSGSALRVKDQLLSLNGSKVTDLASVHKAMESVKPGDSVKVELLRGGKRTTVQAKTAAAQGSGRAVFGIGLAPEYDMPFQVKVNTGEVGGPSAGMMFALAIYDKITPGALTGGKKVAGSGTIDETGAVGPIGAVKHKMLGAKRAGATYFLASSSNCDEVVGNEPSGMTVVKVNTIDDALAAMPRIAKGETKGLPTCTK